MLEKMLPVLRGLVSFFQLEDHYDVQMFLNQLYEIEDEMKILHAPIGRFQATETKRYGANDVEQLEDDEYYDDEDEAYGHHQDPFRKGSKGLGVKNKRDGRHR